MSPSRWTIGLDAGGSNTVLYAEESSQTGRIERRGSAANLQRAGREGVTDVFTTLIREALGLRGSVDRLAVCAGVSGAGRADEQADLAERLRAALADRATSVVVDVVHDAVIALEAAYGSGSGVVVIVGTGSVVYGRAQNGACRRVGGWGHLLAHPGSGYAVGRAGLRAVAEAIDGGAETALRRRLADRWGVDGRDDLIRRLYQEDFSVPDVAPLVVQAADRGDAVAKDVMTGQVDGLVQQVGWLLDAPAEFAPRISVLGGMLENPSYAQLLRRALQDRFPDWSIDRLEEAPAVGALRRARRLDP